VNASFVRAVGVTSSRSQEPGRRRLGCPSRNQHPGILALFASARQVAGADVDGYLPSRGASLSARTGQGDQCRPAADAHSRTECHRPYLFSPKSLGVKVFLNATN
jgi:hypothetical protein